MWELISRMQKGEHVKVELEDGDDFELHLKAVGDVLYALEIDYVEADPGEWGYAIAVEAGGSVQFWREPEAGDHDEYLVQFSMLYAIDDIRADFPKQVALFASVGSLLGDEDED